MKVRLLEVLLVGIVVDGLEDLGLVGGGGGGYGRGEGRREIGRLKLSHTAAVVGWSVGKISKFSH